MKIHDIKAKMKTTGSDAAWHAWKAKKEHFSKTGKTKGYEKALKTMKVGQSKSGLTGKTYRTDNPEQGSEQTSGKPRKTTFGKDHYDKERK